MKIFKFDPLKAKRKTHSKRMRGKVLHEKKRKDKEKVFYLRVENQIHNFLVFFLSIEATTIFHFSEIFFLAGKFLSDFHNFILSFIDMEWRKSFLNKFFLSQGRKITANEDAPKIAFYFSFNIFYHRAALSWFLFLHISQYTKKGEKFSSFM